MTLLKWTMVAIAVTCLPIAAARAAAPVTTTTARTASQAMAPADYARALPMTLPRASKMALPGNSPAAATRAFGSAGAVPGALGSGQRLPSAAVPTSTVAPSSSGLAAPGESGSSGQPYTTSWANAQLNNSFDYFPLRPTGRLFFRIGSGTFVCSASLIKPGVVVTAAHCVANFGRQQFYNGWTFVPAYFYGSAPFGVWPAASATVMSSYFVGTDSCAQTGVVCTDDVALVTLAKQNGKLPGASIGYYGYSWGGYGFSNWAGNNSAQITQLGYPVALDSGNRMERTDSQGFVAADLSNNTVIGSLMTGGASGGPWLINFGIQPYVAGVNYGNAPAHEIVMGVTSWLYADSSVKQLGSSPFTSDNIVQLVSTACALAPGNC
jgi:V8-like Glu-specific endopeptidase